MTRDILAKPVLKIDFKLIITDANMFFVCNGKLRHISLIVRGFCKIDKKCYKNSHRLSLLRSMFSKFKEKNTTCVELKDVTDPRIMSQIIHYMYFNAVSLSPATVQDILSIANYLQIDSLTAACVQFIKERFVL